MHQPGGQGAEACSKWQAQQRGKAQQGETPEGRKGAQHGKVAVGNIEKPQSAIDKIQAQCGNHIEAAQHESGKQQLTGKDMIHEGAIDDSAPASQKP